MHLLVKEVNIMLAFIIGLFIGAFLGVMCMALCVAARDDKDD